MDCNVSCRCSCSHAIAKRAAPAASAPQKPSMGVGSRPDTLVRTDRHTQKLHKFFLPSSQGPLSSSPPAQLQQEPEQRGDGHEQARHASSNDVPREVLAAIEECRGSKRPRHDSMSSQELTAAREKLQMGAHSGDRMQVCIVLGMSSNYQLCQHGTKNSTCSGPNLTVQPCARPACVRGFACAGLRQRLQHFVPVGQVDEHSMLVQEGLDLVLVNTSVLAHDLFYQLVRPPHKFVGPYCLWQLQCSLSTYGREMMWTDTPFSFVIAQAIEGWGTFPSISVSNPERISSLAGIAIKHQVSVDEVICHPRQQCCLQERAFGGVVIYSATAVQASLQALMMQCMHTGRRGCCQSGGLPAAIL